ncbi:DUF3810 domain-containing protein [Mucilaginibacter myungsuensis]
MKNRPSTYRKQLIAMAALCVPIILLSWFQNYPYAVERFYSSGFYRGINYIIRPVVNVVPFSIGDFFYTVIIILLLSGIYRFFHAVFKGRFKIAGQFVLRLIIGLQIGWLWFYTLWGTNYYRPPAAELLHLTDTSYTLKDVADVAGRIIDSANTLRATLDSADLKQPNDTIYVRALSAVNDLGTTSPKMKPVWDRAKPSMYSHLLNYVGTSGYYNPFTAEAQINYLMPLHDRPFVSCHEMAHQTGWAREDEANFAGYVAGIRSPDRLLKYSSYFAGVEEFMRYLRRRDTVAYKDLRSRISPLVVGDFKADSAYWTKYQGPAEAVSSLFFDKFLKANNQPHGLRTYNRMIRLTMAYYRKPPDPLKGE